MAKGSVGTSLITKVSENQAIKLEDLLAVEEPLEIRIGYGGTVRHEIQLAVTMRTPGHDFELVVGFLLSESIISNSQDIVRVIHCENVKEEERGNVVRVELHPDVSFNPESLQRNFYTSSSCGVCGKSSIESVQMKCELLNPAIKLNYKKISNAPELLRKTQRVFEYTGGLHAAGLFSETGDILLLREDIGRHNAFDKLVGAIHQQGYDAHSSFVLVSGRTSFELVQKCVTAGIPCLIGVGAPSSLAVDLAKETGLTLLGFVKSSSFNIYNGAENIIVD